MKLAAIVIAAAWLVWNSGRAPGAMGRAVAKLILLAASLAISVLAGEVALRIYVQKKQQTGGLAELRRLKAAGKKVPVHSSHPLARLIEPVEDSRRAYELAANLRLDDFGHKHVHTNNGGMRTTNEYPVARLPHSIRIVGLGDSGIFGWDCEDNENYLAVAERTLNARGDGVRYEALNFGTPGYNTDQEVACYEKKAAAYKPDIVIVGWCENDFFLPMFVSQKDEFAPRESRLNSLLFDRTNFWAKVTGYTLATRRQGEFDVGKVTDDMISGTDEAGVTRALKELQDFAKRDGFHLLIFGPMGRKIIAIVQKLGIDYYNTNEKIAADRYPAEWDVHYMHPRPDGHRVLGEHLAQDLAGRGWLTPKN